MSSDDIKQADVVWHDGHVQTEDRSHLLGQRPLTVWLTGLSASGKSTLAFALERRLVDIGHACYVLDGDNIRHGLNKDLGFSHQDRAENIRRIAEVARLMNNAGLIVTMICISPYRDVRQLAQAIVGAERFMEVYVSTPIETCEAREPRGAGPQAAHCFPGQFQPHRQIPNQRLQPRQFFLAAIGGPALHAGLATGAEVIPPLGQRGRRDVRLS